MLQPETADRGAVIMRVMPKQFPLVETDCTQRDAVVLRSSMLDAAGFVHAFSTRMGGVSATRRGCYIPRPMSTVKTIAVIGAGTMGSGIALTAAQVYLLIL